MAEIPTKNDLKAGLAALLSWRDMAMPVNFRDIAPEI